MKNLFEIIKKQDLDALKEFLVEYPRGMDVETEDGVWALHEVMAQGNLEMAKYVTESRCCITVYFPKTLNWYGIWWSVWTLPSAKPTFME